MKHTKNVSIQNVNDTKTSDRFMFAQYHIQKLFTYIIRVKIRYVDIVHIHYSIFILKGEYSTGSYEAVCSAFRLCNFLLLVLPYAIQINLSEG